MSKNIPNEFVVGFQDREGTYTNRLAFVTMYMNKIKTKKRYEKNFERWRDENIPLEDFDNVPTTGFVIHERSGGNRCWSRRDKMLRVWDPRGWEIEVGMDTIEHLINNTDIVGGEIQGELVYGWFGDEGLSLIHVDSIEYKTHVTYVQERKFINKKNLVVGNIYSDKDRCKVVYLGKHTYMNRSFSNVGNSHLFLRIETKDDRTKTKSVKTVVTNVVVYEDLGPSHLDLNKEITEHSTKNYNIFPCESDILKNLSLVDLKGGELIPITPEHHNAKLHYATTWHWYGKKEFLRDILTSTNCRTLNKDFIFCFKKTNEDLNVNTNDNYLRSRPIIVKSKTSEDIFYQIDFELGESSFDEENNYVPIELEYVNNVKKNTTNYARYSSEDEIKSYLEDLDLSEMYIVTPKQIDVC